MSYSFHKKRKACKKNLEDLKEKQRKTKFLIFVLMDRLVQPSMTKPTIEKMLFEIYKEIK